MTLTHAEIVEISLLGHQRVFFSIILKIAYAIPTITTNNSTAFNPIFGSMIFFVKIAVRHKKPSHPAEGVRLRIYEADSKGRVPTSCLTFQKSL